MHVAGISPQLSVTPNDDIYNQGYLSVLLDTFLLTSAAPIFIEHVFQLRFAKTHYPGPTATLP